MTYSFIPVILCYLFFLINNIDIFISFDSLLIIINSLVRVSTFFIDRNIHFTNRVYYFLFVKHLEQQCIGAIQKSIYYFIIITYLN